MKEILSSRFKETQEELRQAKREIARLKNECDMSHVSAISLDKK